MESEITNNINNKNGMNKNIHKFNCIIGINENNFNVQTIYNNEIISIIIKNSDKEPFKIYKKSFIKNDFINISKYFRIFDNNFEIFEKINLFFINKLFEGIYNEKKIILKIKNIVTEFELNIPIDEENDFEEYINNIYSILKEVKNNTEEMENKLNNIKKDCKSKMKDIIKTINKI